MYPFTISALVKGELKHKRVRYNPGDSPFYHFSVVLESNMFVIPAKESKKVRSILDIENIPELGFVKACPKDELPFGPYVSALLVCCSLTSLRKSSQIAHIVFISFNFGEE